jgi:hypothetical protein
VVGPFAETCAAAKSSQLERIELQRIVNSGAASGTDTAMGQASDHRPDYEHSDADPRLIAALALGGAAFLVLAPYILLAAYPLARHQPQVPTAEQPPKPRLQIDPHADLEQLRAAKNAKLSSYGWIDRSGGIVRVPINQAMRLTAEHGIPGWSMP